MEQFKVTTAALRDMEMGETRNFTLTSADAINTGKALAYRAQYSLGCRFSAESDYINNTLSITKLPKK